MEINVERFTKENLKAIRMAFQDAIKPVNKLFGIEIKMGNISFDEAKFTSKLTCQIPGKVKAVDYSEIYPFMGLPKLGTKFIAQGNTFEVIEHKPNRPKYPVIAVMVGTPGKKYKFQASSINDRNIIKK